MDARDILHYYEGMFPAFYIFISEYMVIMNIFMRQSNKLSFVVEVVA